MYQSPDFVKVPVKVEDSFASYGHCIPLQDNDNIAYLSDHNVDGCKDQHDYGTFVQYFSSQPKLCFTNDSGAWSI